MQAGALLAERKRAAFVAPVVSALAASQRSRAGTDIGGYRPLRLLHRNAGTAVWEAVREGRRYALKYAENGVAYTALRAEFELASGLDHPHLVAPLAWLENRDGAAIVFDYLAGGDLVSLAGAPVRHWIPALIDVIDAVAYLHECGFVHRDIKARNVLFGLDDRATLIDLGSCVGIGSVWTDGGTTALHRRPDKPAIVTAADDVYALSRLIVEMLPATVSEDVLDSVQFRQPSDAALSSKSRTVADAGSQQLCDLRHVLESVLSRVEPT